MPFTPYHFGPGLLVKSIVPRWFSLTAFMAVQVVIDCETLYHLIRNEYPLHTRLHTFLGATIAGAATASVIITAKWIAEHGFPQIVVKVRSPAVRAEVTTTGLVVGGLVGGASHPFLDGLLYTDIRPFLPLTERNPLFGMIGVYQLQTVCEVVALIGFLFLGIWAYVESRAA
jgi:hypothetical protein